MTRGARSCEPNEPREARTIDKLLLGEEIARWRFRRLWRHLGECDPCRDYYDRALVAWRTFGAFGEHEDPPQVVKALAAELACSPSVQGKSSTSLRLTSWVLAFGGVATIAIASYAALRLRGGPTENGEWIERGGAHVDGRTRAIRAFCLGAGSDGGTAVLGSTTSVHGGAQSNSLSCKLSGSIQFAYTLGPGADEYLVIVGRDEAGRTFLYEPASDREGATALRSGRDDEPLSSSVRLAAAGHRAGVVQVKAFFTTRPDATAAIRALVDRGQAIGEHDAEGAGLVDEQTLRLVIEP